MTEVIIIFIIIIAVGMFMYNSSSNQTKGHESGQRYFYSKKDGIMTQAEAKFFHRLQVVAGDRYYIFPQIHLSALLKNETKGRYWKAAFQRINRTSVDYVLVHKDSLQVAYAVELDDWSHNSAKRRSRDTGVGQMLSDVDIPLVRFRDVSTMSDEDIARHFYQASQE
jgi:hypothetical protein